MNLQGFSAKNQKAFLDFFHRHSSDASGRKVAVFDADGTLWRGDIGEEFLRHQLKEKQLLGVPKGLRLDELWITYWSAVQQGRAAEAYNWPAQWNAGVEESVLLKWARVFYDHHYKDKVFPQMAELVRLFKDLRFEVWVVSASMRWIVQVGAESLGISCNHVIGASVQVIGGKLTSELAHPVPYRDQKAVLIEKYIQVDPLFAAGNTYWDRELIATSKDLKLAVWSEKQGEINYGSEQELQKLAMAQNWLQQGF